MRVLCGANSVNMKYYFNEDEFWLLPKQIKDELKILLVSLIADVGGAATLQFDDDGKLQITTIDPIDDIGAELKVHEIQREYEELFHQLEDYEKEFGPC